jgi:hypothetical protein
VASRRTFRSSPAARWCVRDMGKGGSGAAAAAGSDWNGAVRCLGLALAMGRADWASYGQPNLSGHSSWFVFFFANYSSWFVSSSSDPSCTTPILPSILLDRLSVS